ncbi:MAG TPA: cysteine synthase A [Sandaracinaceae bacterium LLY-WYZ-13_1]|nr:cysteine synthase A [Sandaracinaceae bacterium LLY-WYZ-13_1]
MQAPVVDSVLELVGRTPLVRLRRVVPEGAAAVWGKAEHLNPGGSVKDRICLAMIERAEREGTLQPGATVVEPTSGNTGIGLALVCAKKGYHLVLTLPASMSLERRQLLEAYGAAIVLTEPERVMEGAIEAAERIVEERGAFMPGQFDNPANPHAHAEHTAVEVLEAMGEDGLDAFVAAVGTGGTVSGVGRVLKARRPEARVVAVEPDTSAVLSGEPPGPSKIQGIGAGFVPRNYDPGVVDAIVRVSDRDAYDMKQRLAREEGLLVGISADANVVAAVAEAERLGPGANVVTLLCDTGERYFSLDEYFA